LRRKHDKKRLGKTDVGLEIFQENYWFDCPSKQVHHQHELQQNWSLTSVGNEMSTKQIMQQE